MFALQAHTIIDSIADITGQRDIELIKISLIKTISDLLPTSELVLFNLIGNDLLKLNVLFIEGYDLCKSQLTPSDIHPLLFNALSECYEKDQIVIFKNEFGMHSVYPLWGVKSIIGFLHLAHNNIVEPDNRLIAAILKVYRNYLSLLQDNQNDALTGLLNRRTFDDKINKIIEHKIKDNAKTKTEENRRKNYEPLYRTWLGIFDIDHFKKINDKYGHVFGDEILIIVSNIIKESFRITDLIFRYGGEEFVTVAICDHSDDVFALFERVRLAIESYKFPQIEQVTISVGLVEISSQEATTTVVGHADQALYYAKQNGRNQVCVYEQLCQEGKLVKEIFSGEIELFSNAHGESTCQVP